MVRTIRESRLPSRRRHMAKLKALDVARAKAQADYLIGIADAYAAGMSLREISEAVDSVSTGSVGKYVIAGDQLRQIIAKGGSVNDFRPGTIIRDGGMAREVARNLKQVNEE